MIGYRMSRLGLRSRAITGTYVALAVAAPAMALVWPVTSFASADYTDRALRRPILSAQPKPRLNPGSATSAPIHNPFYGLIIHPVSLLFGLGGKR